MFGAETLLMNRCENEELFDKTVHLINSGSFFGVIGSSGAGKSTLIRTVNQAVLSNEATQRFSLIEVSDCLRISDNRPMRVPDYRTPAEAFADELLELQDQQGVRLSPVRIKSLRQRQIYAD